MARRKLMTATVRPEREIRTVEGELILLPPGGARSILKHHWDRETDAPSKHLQISKKVMETEGCIHQRNPFSASARDREMCGQPLLNGGGWLCWYHDQQLFPRQQAIIERVMEEAISPEEEQEALAAMGVE